MADLVMRLGCAAALAAPAAALALGAGAPFTPPRPSPMAAAASDAPAVVAGASSALAGVRLGRSPMALLNGAWLRTGDAVRGARLDAIDARGVWLLHANGTRERLWLVAPSSTEFLAGPPR
jgi:hypothetical protein